MVKILFFAILGFSSAGLAQISFDDESSIDNLPVGSTLTFQQDVLIPAYESDIKLLENAEGTSCYVYLNSSYTVTKYIPKGYVVTLRKVSTYAKDYYTFIFQEGTPVKMMSCLNWTKEFSPTVKEVKTLLGNFLTIAISQPEPI